MTTLFKRKNILITIIVLSFCLLLVGCIEKNVNVAEILPESINTMKSLDSYVSEVQVIFTSESDENAKVNMNALITYHKNPFAYSSIQEITSNNPNPDNPFDKLSLSLIVKDGTIYTNNSVTGLWLDETDSKLVKEVEDNGEIFQNFNSNQFSDLEVISVNKNKATIKARSTNSDFIKSLLSSFDTNIVGDVEMIIDLKTKYIESFIYYPEVKGNLDQNNKITIINKDFNSADEVVVPEEALYE